MDPLLEQFLSEARENLAFIDQNIGEIGGDDPELLNSVFRAAHTLKGGSGIVGFESIKNITHHAEDLLDMLRGGKIEFKESMVEALYDAFDEVVNLVEAAEETSEIVDANEEIIQRIVSSLSAQMGKEIKSATNWELPFKLVSNLESILNVPMKTLRGVNSIKVPFKNSELNEEFCSNSNFYAVLFDVDDSCMVYGNDPIYTLSLLGDKVFGVFSCMSDENAKSVLSGTEDEEGLLLKTSIIAFIYASYEDIEDSLFNFIDELEFLPLDISTLLATQEGDTGLQIDSLKELSSVTENSDLLTIANEVKNSMELVGVDTIQYAKLERFLDIVGLMDESDTPKLKTFFQTLYMGQAYSQDISTEDEVSFDATVEIEEEKEIESESEVTITEPVDESPSIIMNDEIRTTVQTILEQQYKAVEHIESQEDLLRVSTTLERLRKFIPEMPHLETQDEIVSFLQLSLGLTDEAPEVQELKEVFKEEIDEVEIEPEIDPLEETGVIEKEPIVEVVNTPEIVKSKSLKIEDELVEKQKSVVGKTVKIDQESIDSLMNVVGELLVAKNSLPYLADNVAAMTHEVIKREIMDKYIFINRLSEQLQDLIMGMRMLPISYVFDRYPKLVRDIAKTLGKKVKLEMNGGETKLDKNMIEMLADPLIHIMRNSLDHGVEMPDVREQKGKDPVGSVSLNAYAQSDRIIIEIIDDGAGINVEKVAFKVLEKGLMTSEQIDALSEKEMSELVLLPGLSTSDSITEFSGRGVGMDVVKKSIEGFGGSIGITTKANEGTVITLAIPMSLAVTSLLHIEMNSIHYGIPMDSVSETVKLERSEIEYLHNEPFVYIRGDVIPLLFIKSMLNEDEMEDKPLSIVVLNIKNNLLAVVVNEFLGQLDVVQKPLVGIMEGHPLFSGTALLGNGQIIMAIDPLGLLGISQKLKEDIQVA
ncbi:chemotaxis protein CheA [Sulfurimonas aquatica]|uniref:Chemotaxis protein CheA n=1 Tax=Sulfurimonas aquatica TaxID=2672570 RepID=A0A975B127_9BACT|nr:chemotaxis protein CheA [Sulfurimonas aquatica]QSZ42286.1 chemotaxis protein CheA [Sulfurimonas aquatica]